MALLDLSGYGSVRIASFVEINADTYGYVRFSNYHKNYTIDGANYNALGQLLGISETAYELALSNRKVTLTISALPQTNRDIVQDFYIKGSPITIKRGFFDPLTGDLLSVAGNPATRFKGIVTNWSLEEDWSNVTQTATNTLVLTCQSNYVYLDGKVSGRRTNPEDFSDERSMDRVPNLTNATFDFGVKE